MTVDKSIIIRNIYYMLSYAFRILKQEDYQNVAAEKFDKIHDLFAEILNKGISRQLKQGLYREYIPMQETLSVMRGKLNINETILQKIQRNQKLSCEYDEFSEDNIYNQILKATIHMLIGADGVDAERKKVLKKLIVFFDNVKLIRPDNIEWNRLIYQRNNRNYELLLNICYLVLNGMLQTTEEGNYKLISFSDEQMDKVYEIFILEYYKQNYPELKPKASTVDWNLTKKPDDTMIRYLPKMLTDITLKKGDKTLIIDAKYYGKSLAQRDSKETLRSAHLYQIFSYVKNMDTANTGTVSGLLLYAKTEDELFPEGAPFEIGGNRIGARTLDLNRDFSEISSQLNTIAEEEW